MTKQFTELLEETNIYKNTENGMLALNTTLSPFVDFMGNVLSYRDKPYVAIYREFNKAYNNDPLLAMKMLFYTRNIRGTGQGERKAARAIYYYLAMYHTDVMEKNLDLIPVFGRYDDYYAFMNTPLEAAALTKLKEAFFKDLNNPDDFDLSLVAKWLPSINTSSLNARRLGRKTAKFFGLTEKEYRQKLSALRKRLLVVERLMCLKQFPDIDFSAVPAKAMLNYHDAFMVHEENRFHEYLKALEAGKTKVNAKTLYPYELIEEVIKIDYNNMVVARHDELVEKQWESLPNYIDGAYDCLIVADTSGSMDGRPLAVALSLAVYFAERNQGVWHNKFITFSSRPEFITLSGHNLFEKLNGIPAIYDNTDIEKVFDLVLATAVKHKLKPEEIVKKIIIVSDMQFDCLKNNEQETKDLTKTMKERYQSFGYELPKLVYWDASGNYANTFHAQKDEDGVAIVSGANPSIFKQVISGQILSPEETVLDILSDSLFDVVKI